MSSVVYEIVELANGEYALQRTDGEGEPLVNIRFSPESKEFLEDASFDVAKIMIQAGMQAVGYMQNEDDQEMSLEDSDEPIKRTLH